MRGVYIHILVFVNINLINEFIMGSWGHRGEFIFGTVACWWHAILSTMNYSAPL